MSKLRASRRSFGLGLLIAIGCSTAERSQAQPAQTEASDEVAITVRELLSPESGEKRDGLFRRLVKLSAAGNAEAAYQAGLAARLFPDLARPGENYLKFLRLATDAGHEEARVDVALAMIEGRDLPRNLELAFVTLRRLRTSSGRHHLALGYLYLHGAGTERNLEFARERFADAYRGGDEVVRASAEAALKLVNQQIGIERQEKEHRQVIMTITIILAGLSIIGMASRASVASRAARPGVRPPSPADPCRFARIHVRYDPSLAPVVAFFGCSP